MKIELDLSKFNEKEMLALHKVLMNKWLGNSDEINSEALNQVEEYFQKEF